MASFIHTRVFNTFTTAWASSSASCVLEDSASVPSLRLPWRFARDSFMVLTLRRTKPLIAALLCSTLLTGTPWYRLCCPTLDGPSFSITERTCLTVGSAEVATASVSCTLRCICASSFLQVLLYRSSCLYQQ